MALISFENVSVEFPLGIFTCVTGVSGGGKSTLTIETLFKTASMRLNGAHQVPAPPSYPGRKFASVEAALVDGPKHFEELMAATGSRDGREIVRALDVLRQAGRLDRDDQRGKWVLKAKPQ